MDMLDFSVDELYFDEAIEQKTQHYLNLAADNYAENQSDVPLLQAYFLQPEHPLVLVALYRFFYYQHRLDDALRVAERVLILSANRLGLPSEWRQVTSSLLSEQGIQASTELRFYLLALKGAGFLELRLGRFAEAQQRLQIVAQLDSADRLGAVALLQISQQAIEKHIG